MDGVAFVGGVLAIKRKNWGWALRGAILSDTNSNNNYAVDNSIESIIDYG
jgi:hypothetical protein